MTIRQLNQELDVTAVESHALSSAHVLASTSRLFRPPNLSFVPYDWSLLFFREPLRSPQGHAATQVVCWQQCHC
jgi:hypothetical protein